VALDVPVKFRMCTWIYGWVIKLCQKIQNGGRRHLELLFRNPGPPTKSTSWPEHCFKISFQSNYYFQRYGRLKIFANLAYLIVTDRRTDGQTDRRTDDFLSHHRRLWRRIDVEVEFDFLSTSTSTPLWT